MLHGENNDPTVANPMLADTAMREGHMTGFEKRPLGRTALEVTALGLGCATLGGSRVPVSREEAEAIVRAAWAAGVRYVDTAPLYGFGQAERCVGDALRDVPRDEWVLSTKVGRLLCSNPSAVEHRQNRMPFDAVFDYSYDAIMRSLEDSLQRLGLGRIDILYVHDIGAMQHGREGHPAIMRTLRGGGYRALEDLRRCGVVRAIGIGVNERSAVGGDGMGCLGRLPSRWALYSTRAGAAR
jgi:D-threo-aldose 1-dehydrogenase